ncbi:MAG: Stealth CR1 domain-containing protein [Lachnospiraceae bacterium]|nr:Stealth CR1 domain-containing protein [Lachnospiraceae bacterium]
MKNDNSIKENSIDIVLPWVDPSDEKWRESRKKYASEQMDTSDNRDMRFRDWDNLQYLFRGIQKYAPWVRKVHFVTCGHLPGWLNTECEKLHIVRHEDYIPKEFLPTFSSHTIELNMHRIEGLSDHFIYFNDDIFIIDELKEEDFFHNGLPCDCLASSPIIPRQNSYFPILFNAVLRINNHFDKKKLVKKRPGLWFNKAYKFKFMFRSFMFITWDSHIGFVNHHLAVPYNKSTLETVWKKEKQILTETCSRKFRDDRDVNQLFFRYWQLASGNFYPHRFLGKLITNNRNVNEAVAYIRKRKGKLVCFNDNNEECDFEHYKAKINKALNDILPEKCDFEK